MTLGEKIREARKKENMTQEQLAEALGVSRQAVTKWEADKGLPDIENMKYISKILNISIDYLLDDVGELDLSVTREAIDLQQCGEKTKWKGKGRLVLERFPGAEIHVLTSKKKRTKAEKIIDEIFFFFTWTPAPTEVAKAFNNLDKQYYLVLKKDDQYLVKVTDEFMETRKLAQKVERKKRGFGRFSVGEWVFSDCGILQNNLTLKG